MILHDSALRQNDHSVDYILHFTDISGIIVIQQEILHLCGDPFNFLLGLSLGLFKETVSEEEYLPGAREGAGYLLSPC